MIKQMIYCDVCWREIGDNYQRSNQNLMISPSHGIYQKWPIKDAGTIDVCRECCKVLGTAYHLGIIDYSMDLIFTKAGFELVDGIWHERKDKAA